MSTDPSRQLVAVLGSGPAGLFAAQELAGAGYRVVVFNRDVKPGGLVEYGVFPTKHKFKQGLRKQFTKTLDKDHVYYRGDVPIGAHRGAVSLDELLDAGFDAVVVAVGAQGTRSLGLPGEEAEGVYHAKDVVYHFNGLPPYATRSYPVGERVVIVGVGNVMVDVAHWLFRFQRVRHVTAVARSVPRFRKYTDKEVKALGPAMDRETIRAELDRIREDLLHAGEDPDADLETLTKHAADEEDVRTSWSVRWLSQPREVLLDDSGRVRGLRVERLAPEPPDEEGGRPPTRKTGETEDLPADNVVFAIGDKADPNLGLPIGRSGFRTEAEAGREGPWAERRLVQPDGETPFEHVFAVGWAYEASSGLVGRARKDGTEGAQLVGSYLAEQPPAEISPEARMERVDALLRSRGRPLVDWDAAKRLGEIERERWEGDDPLEGKLLTNEEMLEALGMARTGAASEGADPEG